MACVMRKVGTGNVAIIFMYVIKCIMVSIVRDICTDKRMTLCMHVPNGITIEAKTKRQATFFERISSCSANGVHREVFNHKMYALSKVKSKETILLRKLL